MKNKKVIIISFVGAIIAILIILGILYFTTDLFKTNQQLFYKYIYQTEIINSYYIKQYNIANDRITKNSNSSLAKMNISTSVLNQETGTNDNQEILAVTSNGLKDALSKQDYRDFIFSSNDQNFLTLKYIRDDNTYAIGADNILAKYLAVENSNLKELFANLGVEDTTAVPDTILTDYEEILNIDENTLNSLKETYGTLIYNNINEESFYKTKNEDKTNTIGVSLTQQELMDFLKIILETSKNDNMLLNLITNKAQLIGYTDVTVENIQAEIQTYIDEITNNTYSTDKDFIKLSLIKKDNKVIKLQLETNYIEENSEENELVTNDSAVEKVKLNVELDFSETNKLAISLKENDIEAIKLVINYSYDDNNIGLNIQLESNEGEESNYINTQYQINDYQTDNISQNINTDITTSEDGKYKITILNNITLNKDVQISKLTTENSAKINNMTSEELNQLFMALMNRITTLYGNDFLNLISVNI